MELVNILNPFIHFLFQLLFKGNFFRFGYAVRVQNSDASVPKFERSVPIFATGKICRLSFLPAAVCAGPRLGRVAEAGAPAVGGGGARAGPVSRLPTGRAAAGGPRGPGRPACRYRRGWRK